MPGLPDVTNLNQPDAAAIEEVRAEILRRIPRRVTPEAFFTGLVRRAIDEILTLSPRRFRQDDLDAPEQTYIGTRSEILIREALDVGIGTRADTIIAGHEVDLKWSKSLNWMIGPENLGTICLGVGTDKNQELSVGLFVPYADRLGAQNRDKKYGAGATFRAKYVRWLVQQTPLPKNFIESLPDAMREQIMAGSSAQDRMRRLAELLPRVPIPRSALRFVSMNKDDFMRRIRRDTSRSMPPLGEMVCLSWKYSRDVARRLGIELGKDEFVFVKTAEAEAASL